MNAYCRDRVTGHWRSWRAGAALLAFSLFACKTEEPPPGPPKLVPTKGTITHEGKPLAGAIVVFNPTGTVGALSIGQTDAEGKFELSHMNFPGCGPGDYKVAVTRKVKRDGVPITLSESSAQSIPAEVMRAQEVIPANYSDLGKTELTAKVSETGGEFAFDLKGPLLEPKFEDEGQKPATPSPVPALTDKEKKETRMP